MKKTALLLSVAIVALGANAAVAAMPCHSTNLTVEQLSAIQTDIEFNMKKIDMNGNKAIDKDEFAAEKMTAKFGNYATNFATLDTSKDGKINSQELMNARLNHDVEYYTRETNAPTNN